MARGASAEASNAMAVRLPKRLEKDLERAQQEMERRSQVRLQMRNESVRAALAFAMAKHPRLGANSSARTLPPFFFESVFDALHVDSVFSVEQVEERVFIGRISGLDGSPYRRGVFHFAIFVPADYPFKPPRVKLLTRIFSAGVNSLCYPCAAKYRFCPHAAKYRCCPRAAGI